MTMPPPSPEMREIEVFLTLADQRHFGRTAEVLRLSTPRVSQIVARMERRIGAALFTRTSRRVELTDLGAQLRDDLEPAHRDIVAAYRRAAAAAGERTAVLRVGFLGPTAGDIVTSTARALSGRDRLDVRVREVHLGDPLTALRNAELDLLLTKFPVDEPDLRCGPVVLRKRAFLAVSRRKRLAGDGLAELARLRDVPFVDIAGNVPCYWRAALLPDAVAGQPVRRGPAAATLQEAILLVASGEAVCTVDDGAMANFARPDIAYLPMPGWPPFQTGFVWRARSSSQSALTFMQSATQTVRQSG
jgi:DNA-binding transcriptional LysR family regulator